MRRAHSLQIPIRNPFAYLPPGNSHPADAGLTGGSTFELAIKKDTPSETKMQAKFFTPSHHLPPRSHPAYHPPPWRLPQARIA